MEDPDSDNESVEESIEKLEEKVESLEESTTGRNQIQMRAYDLNIQASSEDASIDDLAEICSDQMEVMMKQALVGEYQELEENDMYSHIIGGGD